MLFGADLVVADLSTANLNAIFELGVRHALKPRATVIMAESKFTIPFDANHIVVRHYEHLGPDIGFEETMRMRGELTTLINALKIGTLSTAPFIRSSRSSEADAAARDEDERGRRRGSNAILRRTVTQRNCKLRARRRTPARSISPRRICRTSITTKPRLEQMASPRLPGPSSFNSLRLRRTKRAKPRRKRRSGAGIGGLRRSRDVAPATRRRDNH